MLAVIAKLNVKEDKGPEFEKVMLDLAEKVTANEPGNHLYQLCKDAEGNYVVMELYADAEALEAHGKSDHFKAAGAGFAGLMGGAPDIQRLEVISK
jgi:quinol monooxygenase YgiN|tara:strand:- start:201 stop:488 length:288 start_codon:yes stop_codon:yes gene_type:complete